jgi:hypothetical protein
VASFSLGEAGSRTIHFLRQPAISGGGGRLFLGTLDTPCVLEITPGGEVGGPICLPPYHRPLVPESERDHLQGRFKGITDLGLLPLEISREMPWYDRVFSTSRGLVFRRFRDMEERDLVLVTPEGETHGIEGRLPEMTYVGEETILVAWDRMQGTEVHLYHNPWRCGPITSLYPGLTPYFSSFTRRVFRAIPSSLAARLLFPRQRARVDRMSSRSSSWLPRK